MARLVGVKQVWTFILAYGFALFALICGPARAFSMLEAHPHPGTGYALAVVALGVLALMPIVVLMVWLYRRSDEYERHGLLLTHSVAFGVAFLMMAALDFLSRADLLSPWVWEPRWWTMVLCWLVGFLVVRVVRRRDV